MKNKGVLVDSVLVQNTNSMRLSHGSEGVRHLLSSHMVEYEVRMVVAY
jgi:hypothetical protein